MQFKDPGDVYRTLIESASADPNVDALAIQLHPMAFLLLKEALKGFQQAVDARKPVVLWIAGMESGRHPTLEWLEEKQVPVFSSPEKAVRALAALHRLSGPATTGQSQSESLLR